MSFWKRFPSEEGDDVERGEGQAGGIREERRGAGKREERIHEYGRRRTWLHLCFHTSAYT